MLRPSLDCHWVGSLPLTFWEIKGFSSKPQEVMFFAGGATATKQFLASHARGSRLLIPLSDRGFQHLAAAVRAGSGLQAGRYFFDVRVTRQGPFTATPEKFVAGRSEVGLPWVSEGSSEGLEGLRDAFWPPVQNRGVKGVRSEFWLQVTKYQSDGPQSRAPILVYAGVLGPRRECPLCRYPTGFPYPRLPMPAIPLFF